MKHTETKYFLELHELIDREFYDFYREHRTHQALAIDQYNYFEKAVGGMLKSLKKLTVETNGGVHIKGLGYFCHVRSKVKRRYTGEKNPLKKHIKRYTHYLWFYPEEDLRDWYLEPITLIYPQLKQYYVTPESAQMKYDLEDYGKKLSSQPKDIKYLK